MAPEARLASNVAITQHHKLLGGESFKPYGTPGMQFVGRDADLGTEAIFKAICKTG
jgi:hypothetical protein